MNKKKIIRFSIIIAIFLIIFGIVFLLNKDKIYQNSNEEYKIDIIPYNMQVVNEYSSFFSVVNILNNYLNFIHDYNSEALFQILDQEYIDLYNIDEDNLYDNVGNFKDSLQLSFKAKNMAYKDYSNKYLYYVKGDIIANNFEDNEVILSDVMFLVSIDYDNITYAIYPVKYLYDKLPINNPEKEIINNSYNELSGSNIITDDYICNLYLNDFIDKINNNIDDTYYILNEDFRRKQYSKKEDYISFMNNNKDKLSYQVFSCSLVSGKNHIYEIKDMNFNSYTFIEESIMNYKVEFTIK